MLNGIAKHFNKRPAQIRGVAVEPKDYDIMDKFNSNLEKDYFDEKEFSSGFKKKKVKFGSNIFKVLKEALF